MQTRIKTQVVVVGSGPGGYASAFRCADLGIPTVLVEHRSSLGGVCLHAGCIPSKMLLGVAKTVREAKRLRTQGVRFDAPTICLSDIRRSQRKMVRGLSQGLDFLTRQRRVRRMHGRGKFLNPHALEVHGRDSTTLVEFEQSIVATGSTPITLPSSVLPHADDASLWNSSRALALPALPRKLLIVGGGIIGMEIATVYRSFGVEIDVVEMSDCILSASLSHEIVRIFEQRVRNRFNIRRKSRVVSASKKKNSWVVTIRNQRDVSTKNAYDAVLVAIGRKPNLRALNLEALGVRTNDAGFVCVDRQMRTNLDHVYAVGDVTGPPMLAHKGMYQGHVAAEVIGGKNHVFDTDVIPAIAYTDPEVAWVGQTEKDTRRKNLPCRSVCFPWNALGRAVVSHCEYGMTKLNFDTRTDRIVGGEILGKNADELIGEIGLAIEMGCDAEDLSLMVHAHPTLYESISSAAKVYLGSSTDVLNTPE